MYFYLIFEPGDNNNDYGEKNSFSSKAFYTRARNPFIRRIACNHIEDCSILCDLKWCKIEWTFFGNRSLVFFIFFALLLSMVISVLNATSVIDRLKMDEFRALAQSHRGSAKSTYIHFKCILINIWALLVGNTLSSTSFMYAICFSIILGFKWRIC